MTDGKGQTVIAIAHDVLLRRLAVYGSLLSVDWMVER